MRLPKILFLASTLTTLAMFTGCVSESAWTVRDRHGWPVQTWGRSAIVTHRASPCDGLDNRAFQACGYDRPQDGAQRADAEQVRAYTRLHYRR